MKEFNVINGGKEMLLRLPTSIKEITADYLKAVTEDISIAPYYAVIAAVYRAKLPEVISTNKKSKAMAVAIVPEFVKANLPLETEKPTYDLINSIKPADRIIIGATDIERGYYLSTPKNIITMDTIIKIYSDESNKNGFNSHIMGDQNDYYFVDFKLVPITDIKGKYNMSNPADFINPFATVNSKEVVS